jgi:6-phosphogluconolactonase (cycloisomerase 2 family)
VAIALALAACGGGGDDDSLPQTFTVSGSVSGLSGTGLTLQLNGGPDLVPAANGSFSFPAALSAGAAYTVSIKSQPVNPPQTCVLSNGAGSIANSNVTNVSLACTDNSYPVGGTVSGLTGSGLVLQDNAGDDLAVTASGNFIFPTHVRTGSAYAGTVKVQPSSPSQTCVVSNGSGTIGAAAIADVAVDCTVNVYSIGGVVTNLAGSGLTLTLNGSPDLAVNASGSFTFPGSLASGSTFVVTVKAQPTNAHQTCAAANSSGIVGGSDVTSVAVTCTTHQYTVGGTVNGLTGTGLVLQVNGGQDLTVDNDGSFIFPAAISSGSSYEVTVKTPSTTFRERCVASNASGVILGTDIVNVSLDCTVLLGFVYVTGGANGQVFGYGIDSQSDALLPLGSAVTTSSAPRHLVPAPNGATLYATNFGADTISVFAVDPSTGALSDVGTPVPALDGPYTIAIEPSGKFLYVANFRAGNVSLFSIDSVTGSLTPQGVVASTPGLFPEVAITPDGEFLYLLATVSGGPTTLTVYSINATTGALTAGATIMPGSVALKLTIDPLGRFLYLQSVLDFSTPSPDTTVLPYAIDPGTGALTAVGAGTTVISDGTRLTIDPSGQYAYLLDSTNLASPPHNHIDVFAINPATGELTTIGAPRVVPGRPFDIVCDPSGRFVFVGSFGAAGFGSSATWYDVSGFSIHTTGPTPGQLSPAGLGTPSHLPETTPSVIAVIE